MSVYGGDSWAREAQHRKRRVDELMTDGLDASSFKKLSNGKFTCLVCPHHPLLDSSLMLSVCLSTLSLSLEFWSYQLHDSQLFSCNFASTFSNCCTLIDTCINLCYRIYFTFSNVILRIVVVIVADALILFCHNVSLL